MHLIYYLALAEVAESLLEGKEQVAWLGKLEVEHNNLRSAFKYAFKYGDVEIALRLGGALWFFWDIHGYWSEGSIWLETALRESRSVPASVRAKALIATGKLRLRQDDYAHARSLFEQSLRLFQEMGDKRGIRLALLNLGLVAHIRGDTAQAETFYESSLAVEQEREADPATASALINLGLVAYGQYDDTRATILFEKSLALSRTLGNTRGIVNALLNLGGIAVDRGEVLLAQMIFEESLALSHELEDPRYTALSIQSLGWVAHNGGEPIRAKSFFKKSLALLHELGDKWSIIGSLLGMASVAGMDRRWVHAARILGIAESLREAIGAHLGRNDSATYDHTLTTTRAELDEATFATAWDAGRAMTLEQAITYALGDDNQGAELSEID